ncbi:MAG: TIGR03790 family protein [Desulfobulbaceae bacterium]|nr:TIGR03790 family protein [Desulfobulbaceae bacterium]
MTADEIAVIANSREKESLALAQFYMEKRHIPPSNLIIIDTDPAESCKRSDYDRFIAAPIRTFLEKNSVAKQIKCLVTMYGVPLKIVSPKMNISAGEMIEDLRKRQTELNLSLHKNEDEFSLKQLEKEMRKIKNQISYYRKIHDMRASVDSELCLVLRVHPLSHWLHNPFFKGNEQSFSLGSEDVLMVSRLDAATPSLVKKIIDDSISTEKKGLQGDAFFDARWPDPGLKDVKAYGVYDRSIHRAATIVKKSKVLDKVILDEKKELFLPGEQRNAALYCGWYSLAKYIDAFNWQPGAVGYHIASSECTTLKKTGSDVWCKRMLEKGIAATIGPVGEPYVQAFPPPELFFSFLVNGKNLVESYFYSLPHLSWKMVLIGDPLYTPFQGQ